MIKPAIRIRIARPTNNLADIIAMYIDGLGFELLGRFDDHDGFSGAMLGHPGQLYHLEFTHHHGSVAAGAPAPDNLLVFYIADKFDWQRVCENMQNAGFSHVPSNNPYWDVAGKTFEDPDGCRVVVHNSEWHG